VGAFLKGGKKESANEKGGNLKDHGRGSSTYTKKSASCSGKSKQGGVRGGCTVTNTIKKIKESAKLEHPKKNYDSQLRALGLWATRSRPKMTFY